MDIIINMIAVAITSFVNGSCLKIGSKAQTINIKANATPNNLNIFTFAIITLNLNYIFIIFISFHGKFSNMERAIWIILNKDFSLTLDSEILNNKITDKKFSPSQDIWTEEIPRLGFSDENIQKDYDAFINDIITLFSEPGVDKVFIDAKIGEESEYVNAQSPLLIRKIEEYTVDEIIE